MPRRALPAALAGSALLLGRLLVAYPHGEAVLFIEGWCPCCGQRHRHRWHAGHGLDAIARPAAHCDLPGEPPREHYVVALDPILDRESREILARFSPLR